jgi:hypothetical protein
MVFRLGNCPKCGARLLIDSNNENDYDEIDVDCTIVNLTYVVKCWKCGSIVKSLIASNIEEVPMKVRIMKRDIPVIVLETKNLAEIEPKKNRVKIKCHTTNNGGDIRIGRKLE